MDFNNQYDRSSFQALSVTYLIDQKRWKDAAIRFMDSDIVAKTSIYNYLFRKLADCGQTKIAKSVSEHLMETIINSGKSSEYMEQFSIIKYYMSFLTTDD